MLKKLVAAVLVLGAGYVIGVRAGFKAAVHDYVHNEAQMLESRAASAQDAVQLPEEVQEKIREKQEEAASAKRGFR